MPNPLWLSAAKSDIGTVRKVNEDDYLEAPNANLWCVADGMGGHVRGDVASQSITNSLIKLLSQEANTLNINKLVTCLEKVNASLYLLAQDSDNIIGSTVALLYFANNKAHMIWAGDSRIYLLRDGKLQRLTRDHSQVEELLAAGLITAWQAEHHPKSNVITRAIGANANIELEITNIDLHEDDVFMLCTDGLNKALSDSEIEQALNTLPYQEIPTHLIDLALAKNAKDNVSLIMVANENQLLQTHSNIDLSLDETLI